MDQQLSNLWNRSPSLSCTREGEKLKLCLHFFLLSHLWTPQGWVVSGKERPRLQERGRGSRPLRIPPNPPSDPSVSLPGGDQARAPISFNRVNGLLFLRGSTIVAPLTSGGAPAERETPFAPRGAFHAGLCAGSGQGSPPGKKGDRDWARPPHPGLAVRGRRESCSGPASWSACGPGRISQILSAAILRRVSGVD